MEKRDDRITDEEKRILKEKLNDIQEELEDELEYIKEEIDERMQDLKDERDEIREELEEAMEELEDEKEELLMEKGQIDGELDNMNGMVRDHVERFQRKVENNKQKVKKTVDKFNEKIQKKLEKAERKAKKRINISVEEDMSEDWRDWAEDLGTSVSELVRKSMGFVKENIGDLRKLEKMGEYFEKMGGDIEKAVRNSGIEDLGNKIKARVKLETGSGMDKEAIKKRITGIIRLYKAVPIDKLALALGKNVADAETLIYELAGEGLDGTIEDGVFKFSADLDTVIAKFNEKVDQM